MSKTFIKEWAESWRNLHPVARYTVWLLLVLMAPLVFLVLNRYSAPFAIDSGPYFYMHVIERVRNGGQVYVPAGPGYSSGTYAPLYSWVGALVTSVLGAQMLWLRIMSTAWAALYVGLAGAFIWRQTRNVLLTVAGATFLIARYGTDEWMYEIELNAMHTALAVAGFYLLRAQFTLRRVLAAAVLFSLSTLTKQTGLGYAVAATVLILVKNRRLALVHAGVCAVIIGGVVLWQNAVTDGMFYQACVVFTKDHPWQVERFWQEVLAYDLLQMNGILLLFALVPLLLVKKGAEFWATVFRAEYVMLGAGVLVTWIAQPKMGSGGQQALVGNAGLAVCGCIGLQRVLEMVPSYARDRAAAAIVVIQMLTFQMPNLKSYRYRIVDSHDRRAYEEVSRVFESGRTSYLYCPWIATTFGQPESGLFGDESTMWHNGRIEFREPEYINAPFFNQEYDLVILPTFVNRADPTVQAVIDNYQAVGKIAGHPRGTEGGNTRWEKYIFQAKRLIPESAQPLPTAPVDPPAEEVSP